MAQLVKNLPATWETWVGKIPWRRERLPTPVFWPVEFHRLYSPWGRKEFDMTELLSLPRHFLFHTPCGVDRFLPCHQCMRGTYSCEDIFLKNIFRFEAADCH